MHSTQKPTKLTLKSETGYTETSNETSAIPIRIKQATKHIQKANLININ